MVNGRSLVRLGLSAVGWGIGAALASMPGVAAASPADVSWADPFSPFLPPAPDAALSSSPFDIAISVNGQYWLQSGNATATTTPDTGDVAIAIGNHADASATGGVDNFAYADGVNALAESGGSLSSSYDSAIDIGNTTGNASSSVDGAYAGAGSLIGMTGSGTNDFALNMGNLNGTYDGAGAVDGDSNSAIEFGNMTGTDLGATAYAGNGDIAYLVGMDSTATAYSGNYDVATVLGAEGSTATAGNGFSYDLAAVLFLDGANAVATGTDHAVDIIPSLPDGASVAAVDGFGALLGDLAALF
jgi:hypothetical protein